MSASPYYIKLPDKKELFFSFFSKIIFVFLKTIQFNCLNLFLFFAYINAMESVNDMKFA